MLLVCPVWTLDVAWLLTGRLGLGPLAASLGCVLACGLSAMRSAVRCGCGGSARRPGDTVGVLPAGHLGSGTACGREHEPRCGLGGSVLGGRQHAGVGVRGQHDRGVAELILHRLQVRAWRPGCAGRTGVARAHAGDVGVMISLRPSRWGRHPEGPSRCRGAAGALEQDVSGYPQA